MRVNSKEIWEEIDPKLLQIENPQKDRKALRYISLDYAIPYSTIWRRYMKLKHGLTRSEIDAGSHWRDKKKQKAQASLFQLETPEFIKRRKELSALASSLRWADL